MDFNFISVFQLGAFLSACCEHGIQSQDLKEIELSQLS